MPAFWQKLVRLHREIRPIPGLFSHCLSNHMIYEKHIFLKTIFSFEPCYPLNVHYFHTAITFYLCLGKSITILHCKLVHQGWLTDSQGEFVFRSIHKTWHCHTGLLQHLSSLPPVPDSLTNLWAHHTPFGVIPWWAGGAQEGPAFRDDTTQAVPGAVLLRETLHTASILTFPLLAKHSFQRCMQHPHLL